MTIYDGYGVAPMSPPSKEVFEKKAASETKICNCRFCVRSRRWNEIVERKNTEELLELIKELRNDLCCAEEELSIKECILSGQWPTSDVYAKRMLENFEKMQKNS